MGDVINLDDHRPHLNGPARCIECGHEWVAIAPVGAVEMECPNCHTFKGAFVSAAYPSEVMQCECGNQLFYVCDGVATCARCGISFEY